MQVGSPSLPFKAAPIFLSLEPPIIHILSPPKLPKVESQSIQCYGDSSTCDHLQGWHIKGFIGLFSLLGTHPLVGRLSTLGSDH